jgi:hypothetical protein
MTNGKRRACPGAYPPAHAACAEIFLLRRTIIVNHDPIFKQYGKY